MICALAALSASAAIGCGGSSKNAATGGDMGTMGTSESTDVKVPIVDPDLCDTRSKKVTTFDLNHDNHPDVWKLTKTVDEGGTQIEVLTCKQVDFDHDGRKDFVVTYDSTGATLTEEFDMDYDGRFDARHFYDKKARKVYLIERDSDYDNKPDIWEKYDKGGILESVRRDRNADGKPDLWEQYKGGNLVAILYDDDYDARVDRKDEVKEAGASGAEPAAEKAPVVGEEAPQAEPEPADGG